MYKKDIESLLNKGKHYVCQYVTACCYEQDSSPSSSLSTNELSSPQPREKILHEHNHRRLHQVIDHLFDYRQSYTSEELVEWVKYLICGRRLPNNFAKDVKQYDTASKCAQVWTNNFVAYRCRTCAISSCMSLCADCFLNGDHKGHDFNMFRTQSGGACDCGDSFVMKPEGFCRNHQPRKDDSETNKKIPPNSLFCIANEIVPRLLHYLVLYLRENDFASNKKANALINDVFIYLCELGTLMQDIICKSMTDPNSYKSCLKTINKEEDLSYQHRLKSLSDNYRKAVQEIELSSIFPNLKNIQISDLDLVNEIESFKAQLKHRTYLDEIIFWTIINEFPSNLITFLLKILPNESYKVHFAECFVKHYFRIAMLIFFPIDRFSRTAEKDIYHNKLANAVVHISVQLFSNENLARELCEQSSLLYIIILSLKFAFCGNKKDFFGILKVNSELTFKANDKQQEELIHYVVSCDHPILRYHRFWPLISDLNNLFTHKQISYMFLKDNCLINNWFEFMMSLQAMNMNLKSTKADDTNQNFKSSFLAELEVVSCQMWTLLSHLNDAESKDMTINFIQHSLLWLKKWLRSISFDIKQLDVDRCTFHLPLHRYYSVFLNHAVNTLDVPLSQLLPNDHEELINIMAHPLQTLIVSYHIVANMWLSFGPNIKTQALNYVQPNFCNSTIDADLFLVQQIATKVKPDDFVEMFFRLYGLNEHLNLTPLPSNDVDKNRLINFLENGFGLFLMLIEVQLNLGLSSSEVTRKEMVQLLSVSDKTHSQIHDMMPYRCGFLQNNAFIETLNDVAEYKSPEVEVSGSLVQGYFYPKNDVWKEEYNPLFVLYRNAQRREFQASLERFASYVKQVGKYESNSLPWPPFRVPSNINSKFTNPRIILNSKTLHAYFFSILYRSLNDSNSITQHLMSIVIHLLELTIIEQQTPSSTYSKMEQIFPNEELNLDQTRTIKFVREFDFNEWFPSNNILVNFLTFIEKTELKFTKNMNDNIKTKLITGLFHSMMPEDHLKFRLLFSHMDDFNFSDGPIITIENDEENVFNVIEADSEDPSQPYAVPVNSENIANSLISFYIDDEEISDVIRDSKNLDNLFNNQYNSSNDDSSSNESQPSTSSKPAQEKKLIIKTKPFKFQINVNESMLTLLLKLHSKLSEKRDSFKTENLEKYDFSVRIGDGPYFIGCLLKRFIYACAERLESSSNGTMDTKQSLNKVIEFIDKTRQTIWPSIAKAASPIPTQSGSAGSNSNDVSMVDADIEELQRSEKKRKALERKQQIMNKFCLLQNEFIKNNKSTFEEFSEENQDSNDTNSTANSSTSCDNNSESTYKSTDSDYFTSGSSSSSSSSSAMKYQPKTYQCVICMDFGASILQRPFVQVVLFQSSSILNNTFAYALYDEFTNKSFSPDVLHKFTSMPFTNEEYCLFKERRTFAYYFEHKVDRLFQSFDLDSMLSSFNIGWCGGVHAQSCGHFMHMDCYISYISSVYQNRDSNDLIEYSCPLCRKMANSVLPIIPNLPNFPLVQSRKNDSLGVAIEILTLLSNCDQARLANTTQDDSKFLRVLAKAIEDLMKVTEPQYRNIRVDPCQQSLFLFLSSISRTNLEYNIVLWRKMLPLNQNSSCLVPLFHALSLNAKLVLPMYYKKLWAQITGVDSDETGSYLLPYEKQVPLLIKDVSAILLQFLYALPFNIDKAYFLSIVQALLNLNFIQAIVMMTYFFTFEEKLVIKKRFESQNNSTFHSYLDYIGFIVNSFDVTILSSSVIEIQNPKPITKKFILDSLAKVCLPFLRLSSMIFHLLFNQNALPDISNLMVLDEFTTLANYLCLNQTITDSGSNLTLTQNIESENPDDDQVDDTFFKSYINWMSNPSNLISSWYTELDKLMQTNTMAALSLIQESCVISSQPKLLHLPKIYQHLFMFYHKRPCETCNSVPKDPSLCLICGKLICIREHCCRTGSTLEGVAHARKCGAGTALYLAVNSSTIILIRGRKACAWGSVYLDEFGEEDRDLKRGKPLFLCEERYRILEQQWLTHSFLNINKKWVYHKDSL